MGGKFKFQWEKNVVWVMGQVGNIGWRKKEWCHSEAHLVQEKKVPHFPEYLLGKGGKKGGATHTNSAGLRLIFY